MRDDQKVFDDLSADEMLLDDALEYGRIAGAVPGTLRIDHCNRAAFANPEAIRLRSQDAALIGQTELLQAALQIIPRGQATLLLAALRRRLIGAEKDVAAGNRHADRSRDRSL